MENNVLSIVTEGINFDEPVTATTTNKDGDTITIKVIDATDRKLINRIKTTAQATAKINLLTALDIRDLCDRKTYVTKEDGTSAFITAKDRYGVGSAEGLNELFNLGIGKENARAWADVARKFLHRNEDDMPEYNANVPELPISSLVYLKKLVTENEDGTYNYEAFDKFINDNGITALTSQGAIRKLLPTLGKKKVVDTTANIKPIAIPTEKTSRADALTAVISSWDIINKYITANIDMKAWKGLDKALSLIQGLIDNETNLRNTEAGDNPEKWG